MYLFIPTVVDVCASQPCLNGAYCNAVAVDLGNVIDFHYGCTCKPGFTVTRCEFGKNRNS